MVADAHQRRRACREMAHSFAVEASAGTGKTTTLVDRVLHMVLDGGPKGQPVSLSNICAITFTEKAAGEMKLRLRQEFEKRAGDPGPARALASAALHDLESATISTFHAFAVSLLKERPIEAGLDPRFTALDDVQGRLFFRQVWEPWINRALLERRGPLEPALRAGIGLDLLRSLAETLIRHSLAVRSLKLEAPPTDAEIGEQKRVLLRQAQELRSLAGNPDDKLVGHLEKTIDWLEASAPGAAAPRNPGNAGAKGSWNGGKATVETVKEFVKGVVAFHRSCTKLPQQRLFGTLIRWLIGDFLSEWEGKKRQYGFLDFDDQLDAARRLLVSSRAARGEFQKRYATLLVDEFQDTDPAQLEIVLLLSCADLTETDVSRLRPEPGRLFIVGDPKQSIYRFRGADIETYLETVDPARAQAGALDRLELTTNFRSVPSILRFVDEAFREAMKQEENYQPEYLPFGGNGHRQDELEPPSVHILGDRNEEGAFVGSGRDFPSLEAGRVARLITQIPGGSRWRVEDRSTNQGSAGTRWRTARYGDIAILLPVLTRVDLLEEELRAAGVPYVLEGGKFYYARSEVTSALTALRAIANPNDSVALYGTLRSIFFGLSDEDLLRAHFERRPLDYRADVPESSPLFRPYRILRELHLRRHDRPASETFERLLRQTGAREVLAVRGFQSLANLAKLARTLRTIQQDKTYSQAVDVLLTMDDEGVAESESRLMEEKSDAVRILSIHKAKGLDFPIVIIAGLGFQIRGQRECFLADFHGERVFALKLGSMEDGIQTPGWERLLENEKRRESAELVRLLYVALTRARDHLILSLHTRGRVDRDSGQLVPEFDRTRLKPLSGFLNGRLTAESGFARFIDPGGLTQALPKKPVECIPARDWGTILRREREELRRLLSDTPYSKFFHSPAGASEEGTTEERSTETARSRAARLGTAFHEAMERADLSASDAVPVRAAEAGARHQLDDDAIRMVSEMMGRCLGSPLIERARNSARSGRRLMREIPYVRSLPAPGTAAAGTEEGVIDLLFEEPDGWILVDYKTDLFPATLPESEAHFREKYSRQVKSYVEALGVMKINLKAAYLLLARTGEQVEVPLHNS